MRILSTLAVAAALTVGAEAQNIKTTTETKVKVEDGKDVKVVGCVERTADKEGFLLSNLSGDAEKHRTYLLILDDGDEFDDLRKHIGHKVEIKGKAVDHDQGEVEITSNTKREVDSGPDQKREVKTEIKGTHAGSPYLGVENIKMISMTCP
jgi:hypothetical protein